MRIEHIALWAENLERLKEFYTGFFEMKSSEKYVNPEKEFSSYFLSFKDGARIEIMHRPDKFPAGEDRGTKLGLSHIAISVGSKQKVDHLTNLIRSRGYRIAGEPRTTGDGYYESVIEDPEGNLVEITE